MLMRIRPSCVSVMPWNPTRPLAPAMGLPLLFAVPPVLLVPPVLPLSLGVPEALSPPLLPGREPHGAMSRCSGLCMTGELCTLMPGLTARLLKVTGSKSSSLRRLLLIRRVISSAVGGILGPWDPVADPEACGVSERWLSLSLPIMASAGPGPNRLLCLVKGESMLISLIPEDEPRGSMAGGGGVTRLPATLLVSEKSSQNFFPMEFLRACCLKLLDSPESPIMSSSSMSSMFSSLRLGDDLADAISSGGGPDCTRGSRSMSLSRTCRITSASLRNSESTGAPSSASAARMRAKPFVFGCEQDVSTSPSPYIYRLKQGNTY